MYLGGVSAIRLGLDFFRGDLPTCAGLSPQQLVAVGVLVALGVSGVRGGEVRLGGLHVIDVIEGLRVGEVTMRGDCTLEPAIVGTARGHSPKTIERAVRIFIKYALSEDEREEMMSNLRGYRQVIDGVGDGEFGTDAEELDYYLGMCRYSAVTYSGFKERMANDPIYKEKLAVRDASTARSPSVFRTMTSET